MIENLQSVRRSGDCGEAIHNRRICRQPHPTPAVAALVNLNALATRGRMEALCIFIKCRLAAPIHSRLGVGQIMIQ